MGGCSCKGIARNVPLSRPRRGTNARPRLTALAHAGDGSTGERSSEGTCAENSAHSTGENVFPGGLEVGLEAARGSFAVPPVVRLLLLRLRLLFQSGAPPVFG